MDAVEDARAGGARGRAGRGRARPASAGGAACGRACSSLARSEVPMTRHGDPRVAVGDLLGMQHRRAGSPSCTRSAGPAARRPGRARASAWRTVSAPSTLGISTASAPAVAAATRSAWPQGVRQAVDPHDQLAPAIAAARCSAAQTCARAAALASGATASSRSRIRRIGRQGARLLERARVRARHVEHAAARADGSGHRALLRCALGRYLRSRDLRARSSPLAQGSRDRPRCSSAFR